jgi:anti-anti-sigma factor
MSAVEATDLFAPAAPLAGAIPSQSWDCHTARLANWLNSSVAVISVRGEIDALNAPKFAEYAQRHTGHNPWLILDLSGLDFFGTEGFSALHRVSVSCARAGMGWAMVPGAAVSRVLRICDPDTWLPVAGTVDAAMAIFQGKPHRSQQRVAKTP